MDLSADGNTRVRKIVYDADKGDGLASYVHTFRNRPRATIRGGRLSIPVEVKPDRGPRQETTGWIVNPRRGKRNPWLLRATDPKTGERFQLGTSLYGARGRIRGLRAQGLRVRPVYVSKEQYEARRSALIAHRIRGGSKRNPYFVDSLGPKNVVPASELGSDKVFTSGTRADKYAVQLLRSGYRKAEVRHVSAEDAEKLEKFGYFYDRRNPYRVVWPIGQLPSGAIRTTHSEPMSRQKAERTAAMLRSGRGIEAEIVRVPRGIRKHESVFEYHGRKIREADARMPKEILGVMYPSARNPLAKVGSTVWTRRSYEGFPPVGSAVRVVEVFRSRSGNRLRLQSDDGGSFWAYPDDVVRRDPLEGMRINPLRQREMRSNTMRRPATQSKRSNPWEVHDLFDSPDGGKVYSTKRKLFAKKSRADGYRAHMARGGFETRIGEISWKEYEKSRKDPDSDYSHNPIRSASRAQLRARALFVKRVRSGAFRGRRARKSNPYVVRWRGREGRRERQEFDKSADAYRFQRIHNSTTYGRPARVRYVPKSRIRSRMLHRRRADTIRGTRGFELYDAFRSREQAYSALEGVRDLGAKIRRTRDKVFPYEMWVPTQKRNSRRLGRVRPNPYRAARPRRGGDMARARRGRRGRFVKSGGRKRRRSTRRNRSARKHYRRHSRRRSVSRHRAAPRRRRSRRRRALANPMVGRHVRRHRRSHRRDRRNPLLSGKYGKWIGAAVAVAGGAGVYFAAELALGKIDFFAKVHPAWKPAVAGATGVAVAGVAGFLTKSWLIFLGGSAIPVVMGLVGLVKASKGATSTKQVAVTTEQGQTTMKGIGDHLTVGEARSLPVGSEVYDPSTGQTITIADAQQLTNVGGFPLAVRGQGGFTDPTGYSSAVEGLPLGVRSSVGSPIGSQWAADMTQGF